MDIAAEVLVATLKRRGYAATRKACDNPDVDLFDVEGREVVLTYIDRAGSLEEMIDMVTRKLKEFPPR